MSQNKHFFHKVRLDLITAAERMLRATRDLLLRLWENSHTAKSFSQAASINISLVSLVQECSSDEQSRCTWQHFTASEVLVATQVKCYQFKQGQF